MREATAVDRDKRSMLIAVSRLAPTTAADGFAKVESAHPKLCRAQLPPRAEGQ